MESQQKSSSDESKQSKKTVNPFVYSLKIGFFAGLIWGAIRWIETGLNFTEVTQAFLLDPFLPRKQLGSFWWQSVGFLAFILMSIIGTVIYWLVLRKLKGPWPGLIYGAILWGLVYVLAGPLIGAVPSLRTIGWHSIITDFCLFLLWGLMIGYSIAFELHDESRREPAKSAG
ncbi:MAG: YqhR family membrane protein [Candidatus Cohnella colombiensis]|uniref:YqhR family membrane protein n=1 Tax=Candidatus Cohnella colombiensis TaxID=3121368 RepID=A0AA95EZ64_9BACL|nr:MAG: YqhR family membrane protein [Cohnella sp.]